MAQSSLCQKLFIAPGNAGTAEVGTNIDIAVTDFEKLGTVCKDHDIAMLVVGPEVPLVAGIVDYFRNDEQLKSIKVVGPDQKAAHLEGSKDYAKQFMQEFQIPTAGYQSFTANDLEAGKAFIKSQKLPVVLKADGLAAVLSCALSNPWCL